MTAVSLNCTLCGFPVWAASFEELGDEPTHPCCVFWIGELDYRRDGRPHCPACGSSRAAAREYKRRLEETAKEMARQARLERRRLAQTQLEERRNATLRPVAGPPTPCTDVPPPPPRLVVPTR